jgi:hypothetical protein
MTLAAQKRARAKNVQNCFLYRLLLAVVASTFGFQISEIETEFLRECIIDASVTQKDFCNTIEGRADIEPSRLEFCL